jgi:hypothetical protein
MQRGTAMQARVKYSLGRTINTGNYENVKIEVGVEFVCDESEVGKIFDTAKAWVRSKIKAEEKEWLA